MALAAPALAADPSLDSAVSAAKQWVSMSDAGSTDKMWGASSDIMKQRVDKRWSDYLSQLRTEVQRYAGREWVQVVRVTDPVDLPQGQYVSVISAVPQHARDRDHIDGGEQEPLGADGIRGAKNCGGRAAGHVGRLARQPLC